MPIASGIMAGVGALTSIGGMVTQGVAANQAADLEGKVALEQQGVANKQMAQAQADRSQAMSLAAPTAQELQQIGDRINMQSRYQAVQEASLQRDQQILNNLDPALSQAGQQAFQMMKGQEASILAPMKQQQQMQENQLKARLAAQLGPGWETTSAGQQAMQNFQMNSSMSLQQAQMQSFQQVSQFLGFGMQQRTALQGEQRLGFNTASGMSMDTMRAMGGIQERQVGALTATGNELMQGFNAQRDTAGAQYAGDLAHARATAGIGQGMEHFGGQVMGMAGGFAGAGGSGGGMSGGSTGGMVTGGGQPVAQGPLMQNGNFNSVRPS